MCLLPAFLLVVPVLSGCGERAVVEETEPSVPPAPPAADEADPVASAEAEALKAAADAAAKSEAERRAAEELRIKAEAEAKAAAEVEAAAAKAAEEAAKLEREKAEAKAEAKEKESFERAEKLRLERKADAAESRKAISSKTFRLVYADAESVAERFNTTWNGEFGDQWKVVKVAQAFPEANAVMVTAPVAVIEACEKVVREIDVEPRQVSIEARFVELSNNASHKLGIDWQMLDGMKGSLALDAGVHERKVEGVSSFDSKTGAYTIGGLDKDGKPYSPGTSSANLSYVNGTIGMSELFITLRALESSEDARVFSNPKIIVSSGRKATVDMTTKYPNIKISAKRTTNNGSDSLDLDMQMAAIPGTDRMMFANEAFFSWGISLDVTPRVGTNGLISVEIVPTISSQADWVTAGTADKDNASETISAKYPVLDVQRLVTQFNMTSGTTAVIGGLSRTIETQKDNGIPYLRNIWWIGPKLFGSKVRVKEQKEIIVFVTVGLVEPKAIEKDAGLPKNAVLGRQYVYDVRREPGDRKRLKTEGLGSLDMRSLDEQYNDPRWTNRIQRSIWRLDETPLPFTQDPNYKKPTDRENK